MRYIKLFPEEFIKKIETDGGWTDQDIIDRYSQKKSTNVGDLFKEVWYLSFDKTFLLLMIFSISWSNWKYKANDHKKDHAHKDGSVHLKSSS